jgi:hypothetical protein
VIEHLVTNCKTCPNPRQSRKRPPNHRRHVARALPTHERAPSRPADTSNPQRRNLSRSEEITSSIALQTGAPGFFWAKAFNREEPQAYAKSAREIPSRTSRSLCVLCG